MRIVTSIAPGRVERQQLCLQSWRDAGCTVVAVQSPGEAGPLAAIYKDVKFVETKKVGKQFYRPRHVQTRAMLDQAAAGNILILNSDVEIRCTAEKFAELWQDAGDRKLRIGIRWEEADGTLSLFPWGIDAFLITPKIAIDLNDIGMAMGCPAWDYWIPIHLHRKGYEIITSKDASLVHVTHPQAWTNREYRIGMDLIKKHYRMDTKTATKLIARLTGR